EVAIALVGISWRFFELGRRLPVGDVGPIVDFLGDVSAGVRDTEWADQRRNANSGKMRIETESFKVDLLQLAAEPRREVRQQSVQIAQANGLSCPSVFSTLNRAEVV